MKDYIDPYSYPYISPSTDISSEDIDKMSPENHKKIDDIIERIANETIKIKVINYFNNIVRDLESSEKRIEILKEEQSQFKKEIKTLKKSLADAEKKIDEKLQKMMEKIRRFELLDI